MTDFERIRDSALGYLKPSERADWVRDISQEGSDYDAAYQKLMDVRERLSARLGTEEIDEDPEAMMNAAMELEKAVARGIFDAAMDYAAREYHI